MGSLYWDDFEKRIKETTECLRLGKEIPIRRICVHITNKCNFRCKYCNMKFGCSDMHQIQFEKIIQKYGTEVIYHITGGEPSLVKWLYPFIEKTGNVRFHLNTNAFLTPPKNIKRLRISLDTHIENDFDNLVQVKGAFKKVRENIRLGSCRTITSITCVLSKQTYNNAPAFMKYCMQEFPKLYAVFFSCYKGTNKDFVMGNSDIIRFFSVIKPKLEKEMNKESKELLNETIDEKFRLIKKCRFPENNLSIPCYLSMSERVFDFTGREYYCSHLYRDKIRQTNFEKHPQCLFGCNKRLVKFNEEVEKILREGK